MKLIKAMPDEYQLNTDMRPSWRYREQDVIKEYEKGEEDWKPWPGDAKYVDYWVVLKNGYAVGMNENPTAMGVSFPMITYAEEGISDPEVYEKYAKKQASKNSRKTVPDFTGVVTPTQEPPPFPGDAVNEEGAQDNVG